MAHDHDDSTDDNGDAATSGGDFWGETPDWSASTSQDSGRRTRPEQQRSVGSAIKGLWTSALSAGADATREHRIIDATAPVSDDTTPLDRKGMFDDLDTDFSSSRSRGQRRLDAASDDVAITTSDDHFDIPGFVSDHVRLDDDSARGDAHAHRAVAAGVSDHWTGDPAGFDEIFTTDDQTGFDWSFTTDGQAGYDETLTADDTEHDGPIEHDDVFAFAPASVSQRRDTRRGVGRSIDPLLVRVGAVAIAATLMIPLAIGLTSDDDPDDSIESAAAAADSRPTPAPTAASIPDDEPDDEPDAAAATPLPAGASSDPAVAADNDDDNDQTAAAETVAEATSAPDPSANDGDDAADDSDLGGRAQDVSQFDGASNRTEANDDDNDDDSVAADDGSGSGDRAIDTAVVADDEAERAATCAVDYEVRAGDYWIRLAEGAGVPLDELLEANDATADTPLYPGDAICLPAGSKTPEPLTTEAPGATEPPDTESDTPTTTEAPTTTAPSAATSPTTVTPTTATPTTATPTTATPTTAAPTTAAATPSGPDEMKQVIRDVWPDELEDRAIEIAFRESRFDPRAKNFCCYGLFQMYWEQHQSWLSDLGITSAEQLYDPVANSRAAYALYQRAGGWGPWGF